MSRDRWRGLLVRWREAGGRCRGLLLPEGQACLGGKLDDLRAQARAWIADGQPHQPIRETVAERWLALDAPLRQRQRVRRGARSANPATPVATVQAGILARPGGGGWLVIPALNAWQPFDADRDPQAEAQALLTRVLAGADADDWLGFGEVADPAVEVLHADLKRAPRMDEAPAIPAQLADPVADHPLAREPLFARADDVRALARTLADPRSLVLVGPRGCGKSALLLAALGEAGLAKRSWWTSANRLLAGTRWLGEWQERILDLARAVHRADGLLAIESLADCAAVGTDEGGATGLGACLADLLRRRQLRLIAEATPEELAGVRRRVPALAAALRPVHIAALDAARLAEAVALAAEHAARPRRQTFAPGVPALVEELRRSRLPETPSPGWTVRVLRDLARAQREGATISAPAALRAVAGLSGVAERFLDDARPLTRAEVEGELAASVSGQPAAVRAAADAVLAFKAGLADPRRPLQSLLLLGPTGTGKTSLAKAIADLLLPHARPADRLLRLDMSEYAGGDCLHRLVGDGATPGELLRRVRERAVCVVLFDEIEKAHPRLRDVLMGLLDEGRLADALGRVASFRSSIVVMTSNLGADASPPVGFGAAPVPDPRLALSAWRPEFVNRIDRIIAFQPLDPEAMRGIVRRELALLAAQPGLLERRLRLEWDEAVVVDLATRGHDPRFGARPVQRLIRAEVAAPLARELQRFGPGKIQLRCGERSGQPLSLSHLM